MQKAQLAQTKESRFEAKLAVLLFPWATLKLNIYTHSQSTCSVTTVTYDGTSVSQEENRAASPKLKPGTNALPTELIEPIIYSLHISLHSIHVYGVSWDKQVRHTIRRKIQNAEKLLLLLCTHLFSSPDTKYQVQ